MSQSRSRGGRTGTSTNQVMTQVLMALLPGIAAMTWFFGPGLLWNLFWLSLWCVLVEALCCLLRHGFDMARLRRFDVGDGTTLLAAWLMCICLPPWLSPWILLIGALASVGLAKQAYGGIGQNVFNPAMVGYAVMLLSFPQALASWPDISGGNSDVQALTGATLLSEFRYRGELTVDEFFFDRPADSGAVIAAAFLIGGLWLIYRGIMQWRIPLAVLISFGLLAALWHDQGSSQSLGSAWFHWTTGGTVAAAFFVATDPVTHPARPSHQIFFGILVGSLAYLIRTQGNLPDGIAFAVLLANCTTPLFNRLHRQRLGQASG